jgi:hypothetical protein
MNYHPPLFKEISSTTKWNILSESLRSKKNPLKLLISFLVILFFTSSVMSQQKIDPRVLQETDVAELNRKAIELDRNWKTDYEVAKAAAIQNGWVIRDEREDGTIVQLIRLNDDGSPLYYTTDNDVSAGLIGTNAVRGGPYNLSGVGINIGEWDGGNIRATHEQYTGRVTNNDGVGISDHSTHVCGTLIGDGTGDATARGMAPNATVDGYDFGTDLPEMTAEAAAGMIISNHSYGFDNGWNTGGACPIWWGNTALSTTESHWFGQYGNASVGYDALANAAPFYLIVKSAGNDRNDVFTGPHKHNTSNCAAPDFNDVHPIDGNGGTGFDCISDGSTAKNIMTVGALNDDGTTQTTFSNWGPTDDGRIKPDICANGSQLNSSCSASDTDYCSKSGTSMSAPSITGSIALLQEHYFNTHAGAFMRSATAKALVIHTADDVGNPGPDYSNGWGRMNTLEAADFINEDLMDLRTIQELTLNNGGTYTENVMSNGSEPLVVTIVWNDPAGIAQGGLDNTTPNLVNDLDLRITGAGGPYLPWILDPANPANNATTNDNFRDNVENIIIPAPTAGAYTITVNHKGTLSGGTQAFSIVISGINNCDLVVDCSNIFDQTISCRSDLPPVDFDLPIIVESCGNPILSALTIIPGNSGCPGDEVTIPRTYFIQDQDGNMEQCMQTFTVRSDNGPTITCNQPSITEALDMSSCQFVVPDYTGTVTASAECSNFTVTLSQSPPAGTVLSGSGDNTITITATDNCGRSSSCDITLTLTSSLVVDCSNIFDQTISCRSDLPPVDFDLPIVIDSCGDVIMSALTIIPGNSGCPGDEVIISRTYFLQDQDGNMEQCMQTFTVRSDNGPTITCNQPAFTEDLDASCQFVVPDYSGTVTAAAECSNFTTTITQSPVAGTVLTGAGANTITMTATDNCGRSASCDITLTLEDNTPPNALCSNITVQLDVNGMAIITTADIDNGSNDNCGIASMTLNNTDFSCADVGSNTVTLTVTDINGNVSTCTSTVIVEDNVPPVAICQDITIQLDANGMASITTADIDNGSNDACGIASLALDITTFTCDDVGSNTVTLTVTDVNGNVATCTAKVTVQDNIPPTVFCQNLDVYLDENGTGSITANEVDNGSFDNCGIAVMSVTPRHFDCDNVGDNTVTLFVKDVNGNSSTCTAVITVHDTIPPEVKCVDVFAFLDENGHVDVTPYSVFDGGGDNCDNFTLSMNASSFGCDDVGPNEVTLTAVDDNGNSSSCNATITVVDNIAPVAICQDIEIYLDLYGIATITVDDIDNGSYDNCGTVKTEILVSSFSFANLGDNLVFLYVQDEQGHGDTCVSHVYVRDTFPPIAVCKDIDVYLGDDGTVSITPEEIDGGSWDVCPFEMSIDVTEFGCEDIGENVVTLTVVDMEGNSAECKAIVTVHENTAPIAMCNDIELTITESGQASITAADVDAGSYDNCSDVELSIDISVFSADNVGENAVTLTVVDKSGNTSTCTSIVTVVVSASSPVAMDDHMYCAEVGAPVSIQITDNDYSPGGAIISSTVDLMNQGSNYIAIGEGTWTVDNSGLLTFTPSGEFKGSPSDITYTVEDEAGMLSNLATVSVLYSSYAYAGNDDAFCVDADDSYQIPSSMAINYDNVIWSTDGDGNFDDHTALNPVYYPGSQDLNAEYVKLSLAVNSNTCGESIDELQLNMHQPLEVSSGEDQYLNSGSIVTLEGTVSGGSGEYLYSWEPAELLEDATVASPTTIGLSETTCFTLTVTDLDGRCILSASDEVCVHSIVGVAVLDSDDYLVFPNPVEDMITIKTGNTDTHTLELMNELGKVILKKECYNQTQIDMSNYSDGAYLLMITSEKGITVKKIIKI